MKNKKKVFAFAFDIDEAIEEVQQEKSPPYINWENIGCLSERDTDLQLVYGENGDRVYG